MLDVLGGLAEQIGKFVLKALIEALNLVIAAIGAVITTLMGLLPDLPDVPQNPAPQATGWVNYFINTQAVMAAAAILLAAWAAILVIRIGLKWAKAL